MAPLPSRRSLEAMKRVDLQRICKDYGVKANLKSEALIDLLLDTQSTPAPQPVRTRSVSTRIPSRAGPSRVSSMIVHDINEEEDEDEGEVELREPEEKQATGPLVVPPPRTRKAKETQRRLGVGKPVIAGGQGPRAITKSSGSIKSRGLRAKSSITMKPMESTIEEEPEPTSSTSKEPPNQPEDTLSSHATQNPITTSITLGNDSGMLDVNKLVEDAIRPLHVQIQGLKSELSQVNTIKSNFADLQGQVADVRRAQGDSKAEFQTLHELLAMVLSLKEEVKQLREDVTMNQQPSRPSTPKAKSSQPRHPPIGFGLPSAFKNIGVDPTGTTSNRPSFPNVHPGIAQSTLGKRPRKSTESNIIEEGDEDGYSENELANKVVSPMKKRPRRDDGSTSGHAEEEDADNPASNRILPTFAIFRGSEEPSEYLDPPPPTDHLPDLFEVESSPSSSSNRPGTKSASGVPTSSANAAENQQHPFGFSYLPITSTPQNPMYMPSFPYPEPPQSPSPAGPSSSTFMSGRQHEERTDIFKSFGFPSPLRSSSRHYGSLAEDRGGFVNPAALSNQGQGQGQGTSSGKQKEVSSNDVAAGLGLTTVRTTSSSDAAAAAAAGPSGDTPPSKRTMYGTELDSDTRFGDFGVEGVATGFWTTGKF